MIDEKKLEFDNEFGITEDELDFRFKEAVRIEKEIYRIKKHPTSEYDDEKGLSYILYPDGRREYPTID
jgi:hypothetical protein